MIGPNADPNRTDPIRTAIKLSLYGSPGVKLLKAYDAGDKEGGRRIAQEYYSLFAGDVLKPVLKHFQCPHDNLFCIRCDIQYEPALSSYKDELLFILNGNRYNVPKVPEFNSNCIRHWKQKSTETLLSGVRAVQITHQWEYKAILQELMRLHIVTTNIPIIGYDYSLFRVHHTHAYLRQGKPKGLAAPRIQVCTECSFVTYTEYGETTCDNCNSLLRPLEKKAIELQIQEKGK